ncbi:hypothetical protein FQR65_LT06613 [Abscondita terminalis]|nr:hypothetical protein FQR65_LT06613 [Abscondita terminalis]
MKAFKEFAQVQVNSNYQWERLLENKNLLVVDVYSGWCGPCKSMIPTLKNLKNKIGEGITFAIANSENITVLEKFRGKSEPTWLLLADGQIVNVVYGSNCPKLLSTITSELKRENLMLSGEVTRTQLEIDEISSEEPALTKRPTEKLKEELSPSPPSTTKFIKMKFYKHDGTYKIEQDTDFGWWLEDIITAENCEKWNAVQVFPIKSVQETLLNPEGLIESERNKFYDMNPMKEKLSDMTSTDIWKSKLLLSVINFSLFKKLTEKDRSYIEANLIKPERSKIHLKIPKTPDKLNCVQSERLKCSKTRSIKDKFLECVALLEKNLDTIDVKIKEMRQEVLLIKMFFEEENERTRKLLREYRKFSQELRELNYLNEIVLLLMGDVEKIKSNNWPFRICSNQKKELNLII